MRRLTSLCLVILYALSLAAPAAASPIKWSVLDRFRLFDKADDAARERVDKALEVLATTSRGASRAELAGHYEVLLNALSGPAAQSLRTSNWQPEQRRYSPDYLFPAEYRIKASLSEAPLGSICQWRLKTGIQEREIGLRPCSEHLLVSVPAAPAPGGKKWVGKALLSVHLQGADQRFEAPVEIEDLLIVALGDSFISGEGNPDQPTGYPELSPHKRFAKRDWPNRVASLPIAKAQWWDEPCHRSLLSWPVLASLFEASRDDKRAVTLVHLGCSGAEIFDGLVDPQERGLPGCPKTMDVPRNCPPGAKEVKSQVRTLRELLQGERRQVDKLFMSVGGNDIGFAGVVTYLALPPSLQGLSGAFGELEEAGVVCPGRYERSLRRFCRGLPSAEERLTSLPDAYRRLQEELSATGIAGSAIFQTAYPNILEDKPDGKARFCHHGMHKDPLLSLDLSPAQRAAERKYRKDYPGRIAPAGFEGMGALLPSIPFVDWRPELRHGAGDDCLWKREFDPNASEICKANWVWRELNRTLATQGPGDVRDPKAAWEIWDKGRSFVDMWVANRTVSYRGPFGWNVVVRHVADTRGHGWCVETDEDPADGSKKDVLALPMTSGTAWIGEKDGRQPRDFKPYLKDRGRWFRTMNDSILTQYGGPGRFHHGTVHPTFRAHIALAEAVADAAFLSNPR